MDCRVRLAAVEDKPLLRNLLQLYFYDLSEFEDDRLDRTGEFRYDYLDHYWAQDEKGRYAYLFECDGRPAGFALVREMDGRPGMAEFFVLRRYRRQGLGLKWASDVIKRHVGEWEIEFYRRNRAAAKFWKKAVAGFVGGRVRQRPAENPTRARFVFRVSGGK